MIAGAFCYDVVLDQRLDEWIPTKVSKLFGVLILESAFLWQNDSYVGVIEWCCMWRVSKRISLSVYLCCCLFSVFKIET